MLKFGLKNLRRLESIPPVELRPITLLVGRNSSGKSTFLRAFPLLRQSIMTRTSTPLLWYGDLVDFGSFQGSVFNNDLSREISFIFQLTDVLIQNRYQYYYSGARRSTNFKNITFEVDVAQEQEASRISAISLVVDDLKVQFDLRAGSNGQLETLAVNGRDVLAYFGSSKLLLSPGSIFPDIIVIRDEQEKLDGHLSQLGMPEIIQAVADLIAPHLDKRIKKEAALELAMRLLLVEQFEKGELHRHAERSGVKTWEKLLKNVASRDTKGLFSDLQLLFFANQFFLLLREVNSRLRGTISQTLYIGPARARSERYYRYQDLSVSEIDPDGKNFAMFLNSLRWDQLESLSAWVERLFGYRVSLSKTSGHISINLKEEKNETNIVDTGYGVSQILPVLGQMWWAANRDRGGRAPEISMLSIEQPELHLHPAHQSLLADALADELLQNSSRERARLHFLVETHSETLVNRLGQLIGTGKISADDVQVLIFETSPANARKTDVRIASFGSSGELINWPYGFFQPALE